MFVPCWLKILTSHQEKKLFSFYLKNNLLIISCLIYNQNQFIEIFYFSKIRKGLLALFFRTLLFIHKIQQPYAPFNPACR